jgi:hypothetical protein
MVNQCKVSAADAPLDFIWGIWVRQAEQAAETGIWFGPYSICSSGLFVIFGVYLALEFTLPSRVSGDFAVLAPAAHFEIVASAARTAL